MSNFRIQIQGGANLAPARAEFAKLQAEVHGLNAAMERSVILQGAVNPQGYAQMAQAVKVNSQVTRNAALSTGMFEVQQLRLNSATESYTEALQKQKLTFRQWYQEFRKGHDSVRKAAYKEQLALRQMVVQELPGTAGGKKVYDIYVPNEVHKSWDTLRERIGFAREELKAASTSMVNFGKNTQWAGRQLMVGFTMPVIAFGAATGVLAYQVDKEMTRIQKVYDTTAQAVTGDVKSMAAVEQELARVRMQSLATARNAANQYGVAATDTLAVQAELAATGQKGLSLQEATTQVVKAATLGEIEHADALKTQIAMQSIMGMTNRETAESWAYLNAIENATSLATQDFAKAIPIALGPMKEMGGTLQDLGTLMVAMKERGIQAGEGANAIKSMMQRLYRPSRQVREEFEAITGVNPLDIRDKNAGNIMGMLTDIANLTDGLDRAQKIQVIGGLIGTYQVTRVNAVLEGLKSIESGTGQVARAQEVAAAGATEWANIQDREIARMQQSLSGRFKRSLESVKVELAEMGKPFLEIAIEIMDVVDDLMNAFNNLPDGLKKFLAGGAVLAAAFGPAVMLGGLTANFFGHIIKGGVAVAGLATNFGLLNKETQAAKLAADLANKGFLSETEALARLTAEMRLMTQAAREGALAQKQMMLAANSARQVVNGQLAGNVPITPSQFSNAQTGRGQLNIVPKPEGYVRPASAPVTGRSVVGVNGAVDLPMTVVTPESAENAKQTSKWLQAGAVSAGVSAAAMTTMMVSSNETVNNLAQFAMITSMAAPLFSGIATGLMNVPWATMGTKFRETLSASSGLMSSIKNEAILTAAGMGRLQTGAVKMGAGMKAGLTSILGMVSPIGWVGIAIAGAAASMYMLEKHTNKAAENVKEIYADADGLASILGYSKTDMLTTTFEDSEQAIAGAESQAQKFRETYGGVTDAIRNAETDQQAFNYAMQQGLKVIQTGGTAEQAEAAVAIALRAAKDKAEADEIILKFKAQMDFSNIDNIVNASLNNMDQLLSDSDFSSAGGVLGFLYGDSEPAGLSKWLDGNKWTDWMSWSPNESELQKVTEGMTQAGTIAANAFTTALDNNAPTANIAERAQTVLDQLNEDIDSSAEGSADRYAAEEKRAAFLEALVKGRVSNEEDYVDELDAGASILEVMKGANMTIVDETGKTVDNVEQLEGAITGATGETERLTAAQRRYNALLAAAKDADLAGMARDAMTDTQNTIADFASNNFSDRMNSAMDSYRSAQEGRMDALQAAQDRAQDAFDARWERRKDAVENAFDKRIDAIDREIEAEQKADEIRQKIFDAEIQRMQRLAEMQNANIDFNVALNAGDMDEAAKIRNDMQAKETEWLMGAAGDRASEKSEKRVDRLSKKKDRLEDIKDRRLEHLAKIEEAERAALQRSQDMRREALQAEIDANIEAQQEIWDNRKENLDKAIEAFRNYVPKNEKDLRNHIERISKQYGEFNIATRSKFNKTSDEIARELKENMKAAAKGLRSEVQWAALGNQIARDMIKGAFGMNPAQFQQWLITGKWPKGVDMTAVDYTSLPGVAGSGQGQKDAPIYHTGGIVGKDKGGRAGFRSGHPDEVQATLLRGEGVLNRDAMAALGESGFRSLNASPRNIGYGVGGGGYADSMGMAGIMGAMMFRAVTNTLGISAYKGAVKRERKNARKAGRAGSSGTVGGGFVQGKGGWHKASVPGKGWSNTHDYRNGSGSPLYAASDGVIVDSKATTSGGSPGNGLFTAPNGLPYRSYGETIAMRTASGDVLRYAHLSPGKRFVSVGQAVKGGALIGLSGNTGNSTGDHTHFDVNGSYNASGWMSSHGISLSKGAQNIKWDNTVANLHKGEAVLTEDINNQFREGVKRFAEGPNSQYNLYMTVNGNDLDEDAIVNKTMNAFRRIEMRKPQSRSGS